MMDLLAWIILLFAGLRLVVSLVNYFSSLYLKEPGRGEHPSGSSGRPFLSVLIPARNEERNLPGLLEALLQQSYSRFELVVYDDHSTDATPRILEDFSRRDQRMRWVAGGELPEGWTGKNHACHRLAGEAAGRLLLFLDADVSVSNNLLEKAVARFTRDKLSLLSIFPHQIMKSPGEWMTVPLMNWILLSLLPMVLVRKSRRPSFAAANGQFMMFDAATYHHNQWHLQVKNNLVEDIEINRIMKEKGHPTATLLGNHDVMCRMYESRREAIHGFAKNVTEFFGGSIAMTLIFTLLVIGGVVVVPLAMGWMALAAYLGMVLVMKVVISKKSRQPVKNNIVYHIPQMTAFILIAIRGVQVRRKGKYLWKGRTTG